MRDSGLKAREIEALVYIQSPQRTGWLREHRRPRSFGARARAAGALAVIVTAAALAWVYLRS